MQLNDGRIVDQRDRDTLSSVDEAGRITLVVVVVIVLVAVVAVK